jgi:hypothetical protein
MGSAAQAQRAMDAKAKTHMNLFMRGRLTRPPESRQANLSRVDARQRVKRKGGARFDAAAEGLRRRPD